MISVFGTTGRRKHIPATDHALACICTKARIGLGSVAPIALRAREAEAVLEGNAITDELIEKASYVMQENLHPISDIRSTAEYRLDVTRVLVERALLSAYEKAAGGDEQ